MERPPFKSFDLPKEEFKRLGYQVIDLIAEYFDSICDIPVYNPITSFDLKEIIQEDLPQNGQPPEQLLQDWQEKALSYTTHNTSPRYFGFVMGSGSMMGVLAEALAASVNMNVGVWKAAPSATEIERLTIRWLAEMIGYSTDCGGILTTGGTMANFTAILTALRNSAPYDSTTHGLQQHGLPGKFRVYMSDQEGHISIVRAVDMLNLGRDCIRKVKSHADFSMDRVDLERMIEQDLANGDIPLCVVAQVGAINTGIIDPLEAIAEICSRYNIWFHADGACGAVGRILPEKANQYKGLELADSVTLDPHKWLYIPYDCGCVLVRDAENLRRAFSMKASYLRGTLPTQYTGQDFFEYGPEMSRAFRALKVWMALKYLGVDGYRTLLRQNVQCVEHLHKLVENDTDFEVLHQPNLMMYSFRFNPVEWEAKYSDDPGGHKAALDKLNQKICDEIQLTGKAFIMSSRLRDNVVIRLSVSSHRTTLEDIDVVFSTLKEIGENLLLQE
jgi:aromatic-L-amino-acid decarboxylase